MTLRLQLTSAEEAKLMAKARSEGTTLEDLVRQAIDPLLASVPDEFVQAGERQDWDAELEKVIDTLPELPILPDSALTREGIYAEDDER
jgi:hypothetical protein